MPLAAIAANELRAARSAADSEVLSVPFRPLVLCRLLVDRLPLVVFLTKMAAVASEKTIRSSFPGIMLWLCEATLHPQ
jgi:hypothetical protein